MNIFLSLALKVLGWFGGVNAGNLITGVTDVLKNKTNAELASNQTGADLAKSYLQSSTEIERIKAEHQTPRQIMFGLFGFALPAMLLWWAACLDSIPFWIPLVMDAPHKIGSWKVDVPPLFVADFHMIIQSFFIAAPATAGIWALAKVFSKK